MENVKKNIHAENIDHAVENKEKSRQTIDIFKGIDLIRKEMQENKDLPDIDFGKEKGELKEGDPFYLSIKPREVSFGLQENIEASDLISELHNYLNEKYNKKIEPRDKNISDLYLDTKDREFFKNKCSLRLRRYPDASDEANFFDSVIIGWKNAKEESKLYSEENEDSDLKFRTNDVLVQSFSKVSRGVEENLVEKYLFENDFEKIEKIEKKRTKFEIVPTLYESSSGEKCEGRDLPKESKKDIKWVCVDQGLRVLVDEFSSENLKDRIIIEVEFDPKRVEEVEDVCNFLKDLYGESMQDKKVNKIVGLMEGRLDKIGIESDEDNKDRGDNYNFETKVKNVEKNLDMVEIEKTFSPFSPGENFFIEDRWRREAFPVFERVKAIGPGRLHFSLLNYNHMNPPIPGGGGIGISTTAGQTEFLVSLNELEEKEQESEGLNPAIEHILLLFRELTNFGDKIDIKKFSHKFRTHSGYGSNVSANTTLFCSLNEMFGNPFSREEIFDILTHNYIEDSDEENVHWGYETGLGEAALLYGGFVAVDEKGKFVGNLNLKDLGFDGLKCLIANPNKSFSQKDYIEKGVATGGETGVLEAVITKSYGEVHQARYGNKLDDYFKNTLKPLFENESSKRMLNIALNHLNKLGTFKRMQMSFNKKVMLGFERSAQELGSFYTGISSAGPTMFSLVEPDKDLDKIVEGIKKEYGDFFDEFSIAEVGSKIKTAPSGKIKK